MCVVAVDRGWCDRYSFDTGFVVDVNRRAMDWAGLDLTIVVPGELATEKSYFETL